MLLLVAALVALAVADCRRRRPNLRDDDAAGEEVCAAWRSGCSWVARGRVADAHDGGCDGGEHCRCRGVVVWFGFDVVVSCWCEDADSGSGSEEQCGRVCGMALFRRPYCSLI